MQLFTASPHPLFCSREAAKCLPFISEFGDLSISRFFFLIILAKSWSILLTFSENQLMVSLIFLYFSMFFFINFHPHFYYFLPSAGLALVLARGDK